MEGYLPSSRRTDFDLKQDDKIMIFNDKNVLQIISHIREKGLHAYLLSQPGDLPFGHTREDILIEKP